MRTKSASVGKLEGGVLTCNILMVSSSHATFMSIQAFYAYFDEYNAQFYTVI